MIGADHFNWQLSRKWRRVLSCTLCCALLCATPLIANQVWATQMKQETPAVILHNLKSFRQMGSALYIAAHPDDENTELLTYLSRGRKYRTAYLSLTRGDGGQNVLGPDLGAKLGIARTQELLAARHIDGAQQFFSRAIDFGFSKSYIDTLEAWNKKEILSDTVRIIRQFKPDVLITRFSPSPGGTHGHHTASTVLALEAFKLAGDKNAFPELDLAPWQPKRILWNTSPWQKDKVTAAKLLKIESGGIDAVSGKAFVDIAGESRAMHKTQGFDTFKMPVAPGPRTESFQLLDGEAATQDIMDGVDTSWKRVSGGDAILKSIDEIIADFKPDDVSASVPALLKLRAQLTALPHSQLDSVIVEKRALLDGILQLCLGLEVETTIAQNEVLPGEPVKLRHVVRRNSKSNAVAVKLVAVRYPTLNKEFSKKLAIDLNKETSWDTEVTIPTSTHLAQPWWLRVEGTAGLFTAENPDLIGTAENAPSFPIDEIFEVDGQTFIVHDQPVTTSKNESGAVITRRLDVISPVFIHFNFDTMVFTPGTTKAVEVEVTAASGGSSGTISLQAPGDWNVSPSSHKINLTSAGQREHYKFSITAPPQASTGKIAAVAEINGVQYSSKREEINYLHIPRQLMQAPAVMHAVSIALETRGKSIGYIPGAGDSLSQNLQQMGYTVTVLDDTKLTLEQLQKYDAIIIGVRAFNVSKSIAADLPAIFEYVKSGGTVITQYNRPDKLVTEKIAPYDLHISSGRVTDKKAEITFLAPENPILNSPNKITAADFEDWVQERGLYFANQWDPQFTPLIACNDTGEAPLKGGLLVAQYGKGHYIYTGLSFFRQLPAGVPGAYRLLANMIAIGK